MRPNPQTVLEAEIELTAQELLAPLGAEEVFDIEDIVAADTTYENADTVNTDDPRHEDVLQETSEIELTADEMDAMLEGRWP